MQVLYLYSIERLQKSQKEQTRNRLKIFKKLKEWLKIKLLKLFDNKEFRFIFQTTLSRVICDTSDDIRHVQLDAFQRVERRSDYTPCNAHRKVDLRFWKECCVGQSKLFEIV